MANVIAEGAVKVAAAWSDGIFSFIGQLSSRVPLPLYAKAPLKALELTSTAIFTGFDAGVGGSLQKALLGTVSGIAIGGVVVAGVGALGATAIATGATVFFFSLMASYAFDEIYDRAVDRGILDGGELQRIVSNSRTFGERFAEKISSVVSSKHFWY